MSGGILPRRGGEFMEYSQILWMELSAHSGGTTQGLWTTGYVIGVGKWGMERHSICAMLIASAPRLQAHGQGHSAKHVQHFGEHI